jgi:hypothetical protein
LTCQELIEKTKDSIQCRWYARYITKEKTINSHERTIYMSILNNEHNDSHIRVYFAATTHVSVLCHQKLMLNKDTYDAEGA